MSQAPGRLDFAECLAALKDAPKPFIVSLEHGECVVELFKPRERDTQGPHDRDELYVVASGSGTLWRGDETIAFTANDVLFVPAHMPHRFETFSGDFSTWVIFFGPKGGSAPG